MAEQTATYAEINPLGHMLDDYAEWVNQSEGTVEIDYDEEDDSFEVVRNDARPVVIYSSDIDGEFYNEGQAVFVEAEIGEPASAVDLAEVMRFSGDELVLSRISLADRDEGAKVLVVEAALPTSLVEFSLFDLMVREVATISSDIRRQLGITSDEDDDGEQD